MEDKEIVLKSPLLVKPKPLNPAACKTYAGPIGLLIIPVRYRPAVL